MEILLQGILALLLLMAAAYAHRQIPVYTKGRTRIIIARAILLLAGTGFGMTGAAYAYGRLPQLIAFLIGFGMVHIPAAIILFIKNKRGAEKS
jgi:hypothetical protein